MEPRIEKVEPVDSPAEVESLLAELRDAFDRLPAPVDIIVKR